MQSMPSRWMLRSVSVYSLVRRAACVLMAMMCVCVSAPLAGPRSQGVRSQGDDSPIDAGVHQGVGGAPGGVEGGHRACTYF